MSRNDQATCSSEDWCPPTSKQSPSHSSHVSLPTVNGSTGFLVLASTNDRDSVCNFRLWWYCVGIWRRKQMRVRGSHRLSMEHQTPSMKGVTQKGVMKRSFKRWLHVLGWHKGKKCLREPVSLKNVPCCSNLNCLSSLEWKNVGHGGEACQKSLLELQWNGRVCAQKGLRLLVFTSALSYPDVVFFIFFFNWV